MVRKLRSEKNRVFRTLCDGRSLVQPRRPPSPFQLLPWLPVALVVALLKKPPEPEKGLLQYCNCQALLRPAFWQEESQLQKPFSVHIETSLYSSDSGPRLLLCAAACFTATVAAAAASFSSWLATAEQPKVAEAVSSLLIFAPLIRRTWW